MASTHKQPQGDEKAGAAAVIQRVGWRGRDGLGLVRRVRAIQTDGIASFASDGFVLCDFTGRILVANDKAAAVLGLASVETLVKMAPELLAQRFIVEEWDGTRTTRPAFPAMAGPDRLLRFRDPVVGWDRWTLVRTQPFAEWSGTVLAVLHVLQDVTEERRGQTGQQFLAEASQRLGRSLSQDRVLEHAVVAAVPRLGDECLFLVREGARFVPAARHLPGKDAAERAQQLLRRAAPSLRGLEAASGTILLRHDREAPASVPGESVLLVPIRQDEAVVAALLLAMAPTTGRAHHPTDLPLGDRLGELVASALGNAALLASERRQRHCTEQREAIAQRAWERGAALLRIVGHELDRPLSPLVSAAEQLAGCTNDPEERRLAEQLRRQSQELHTVVASLLEFSQLTSGTLELDRQVVDLREVLEEALTASAAPALVEAPRGLYLFGDFRRLARAFAHLAATVTAPPGQRVSLRAAALGDALLEVTIQAHAAAPPTIPLEDALEQFSRPNSGCALALATARQLIELHGGRIWAQPPGIEGGAAFRVQLARTLAAARAGVDIDIDIDVDLDA